MRHDKWSRLDCNDRLIATVFQIFLFTYDMYATSSSYGIYRGSSKEDDFLMFFIGFFTGLNYN